MSRLIDLIGEHFGRLIVIQRMDNDKNQKTRWLCQCSCGNKIIAQSGNLQSSNTRSCGCLAREGNNMSHGHSKKGKWSKTYESWAAMVQRCTDPNCLAYHRYGGRGITVCSEWMQFKNFLKDMGEPPVGYQIDRMNNNKNYYKSNCRWATRKEQARNTRSNHLETFKGKTQCLAAWAEEYNINYQTLCSRINLYGWTIEKTLTTPVKTRESKNG